jgi:hypothetical protein
VDQVADDHPNDVVRRGSETSVAADVVGELIDQSRRDGSRVLGLKASS